MAGEKNLDKMIANMEPELNAGEYVFASVVSTAGFPREILICEMKEKEGTTIVLTRKDADELGVKYDFVATWITLNIHSSLQAVGLTAAFSKALSDIGISCNVIAGYYHDHIFVDKKDSGKAINALRALAWDKLGGGKVF
jgi:hypothetical protein